MTEVDEQQPPIDARPGEEEMRAAYEAELSRITSSEMILQTTVSLLNIGGRRLGLGVSPEPGADASAAAGERDLEQVRDAIDGARALMPILERRMGDELGPLRDAISQLQMAYAREVQGSRATAPGATAPGGTVPGARGTAASEDAGAPSVQKPAPAERKSAEQQPAEEPAQAPDAAKPDGPGPAQASGRLWVPGR
jgi:hypothetical protein